MLKQLLKIFTFPLIVLIVHILATVLNWYAIDYFDKLMHTLGGMSIAVSAFGTYALLHKRKWVGTNHSLVVAVTVVAVVVFAAVAWEWMEFLIDTFAGSRMQISLTDTMADLLAGTLGGTLISLIYLLFPKK